MTSDSRVASFFELPIKVDEKISFKVRCKVCGTEVTGHGKTTSSFVNHVKRKLEALLNQRNAEQSKKSGPQPSNTSVSKTSNMAPKYKPADPHHAKITDALIAFVSQDLMPLNIVESEPFKLLLFTLNPRYHPPSHNTFSRKLLYEKYQSITFRIQSQLKDAKSICLTIDLWSSRQMRGFIGITAHFIVDWTLKSAALACKRFQGSHTAINIYNQYIDVMNTYGITDKITHITTDSAGHMLKAFQGDKYPLSLPGYQEEPEPSTGDNNLDPGCLHIDELEHSSGTPSCPFNDPSKNSQELMAFLPIHDSCFNHTLQNTIKDGFKAVGLINNVIYEASTIISYVRKSIEASHLLEKYPMLQTANATRWNGQLKMIRSILTIPSADLDQLDTPQKLSYYDRSILKDLVEILSPFEEATDKLQDQNMVTSSLVLPVVRGLRATVNSLQSKYNGGLLAALKSSVKKRLKAYEEKPFFVLATVLDPRYKVDWCSSQRERRAVEATLVTKATKKEHQIISPPDTKPPPVQKRSNLFSFMNKSTAGPSYTPISSASKEVMHYLATPTISEEEDPLEFWKENQTPYPILSELAEYHLSLPASSASVERLFSVAGQIYGHERCRLTDQAFENLVMIRCNASI